MLLSGLTHNATVLALQKKKKKITKLSNKHRGRKWIVQVTIIALEIKLYF